MSKENKQLSSIKMEQDEGLKKAFRQQLLKWNKKDNLRQMPWKGEKDPYKIWVSEVILQQTRVEQGMKYYENFIAAFPTVHALAKAPEEKVFKLWEGLGYYSRCKNLIDAARHVSENLDGLFPQDFDSIIQLKGIGSYTASAIASFAFNLPYAVVDGNVFRVLSRIMNIEIPIDSTEGKKHFSKLACSILPKKRAGEFNQAIMDFGASICKPYPECKICFFNNHCKAYLRGKQDCLPVKEKRTKIRERWFNYFVIKHKDEVLIHQRISNDIWQHLFEFVLIETAQILTQKKLASLFKKQYGIAELRFRNFFQVKQKLSHQLIQFNFLEVEFDQKEINLPGFFWVKISELDKYAFPKSLQEFVVKHLK